MLILIENRDIINCRRYEKRSIIMFWKIASCLWFPIMLLVISIISIIKPLKIKGAFVIKNSLKNDKTWKYTNRFYFCWLLFLSIGLLIYEIISLEKVKSGELSWHIARRNISFIGIFILLLPLPITTIALKLKFDQDGNYRKV